MKGREFPHQLSNYQIFEKDPVPKAAGCVLQCSEVSTNQEVLSQWYCYSTISVAGFSALLCFVEK
jgi:hypothetical protein